MSYISDYKWKLVTPEEEPYPFTPEWYGIAGQGWTTKQTKTASSVDLPWWYTTWRMTGNRQKCYFQVRAAISPPVTDSWHIAVSQNTTDNTIEIKNYYKELGVTSKEWWVVIPYDENFWNEFHCCTGTAIDPASDPDSETWNSLPYVEAMLGVGEGILHFWWWIRFQGEGAPALRPYDSYILPNLLPFANDAFSSTR